MLDMAAYDQALKALLHRFPYCDQSVRHAAAVFYGAKDCRVYLRDLILPVQVLKEEIVQTYQTFQQAKAEQRMAKREKRLVQRGASLIPSSPQQLLRYVQHVYQDILSDLAKTSPLQGLRHQKLFVAALKAGSLQSARWLSADTAAFLSHIEDDLLEAAAANGYIDDYGEDSAVRTIDNGIEIGQQHPWVEPIWCEEKAFFMIGDEVVAKRGGHILGQGKIVAYREKDYWEFQLDSQPNVWFAYELLQAV
jgi:hypothetical protein